MRAQINSSGMLMRRLDRDGQPVGEPIPIESAKIAFVCRSPVFTRTLEVERLIRRFSLDVRVTDRSSLYRALFGWRSPWTPPKPSDWHLYRRRLVARRRRSWELSVHCRKQPGFR